MNSVRVTLNLDLTFCQATVKSVSADFRHLPDYCNAIVLWWVTKTVTHHVEVVNGQNVHLPPSLNAQIITPRGNAGYAERPHRGHNTSRA